MDPYDRMRKKLGDTRRIERLTRGFVRLAKKVSKHAKIQKNALETKMDLVEACNKLRVIKVSAVGVVRFLCIAVGSRGVWCCIYVCTE